MLNTALVFFLLALLAALFGFEIIASAFAAVAKIAFFIFVALFILSLISGLIQRGRRV